VKIDHQTEEIELDQQRARTAMRRCAVAIVPVANVKNIFTFE
jgi:hypothetical protein